MRFIRARTRKQRWVLASVVSGSAGISVALIAVAFALPAAAQTHERGSASLHKGRALKAIARAIAAERTAVRHVPDGADLTPALEEAIVEKYILPSEKDLEQAAAEVRSAITHGEFVDEPSSTAHDITFDIEDALNLDRFVQRLKYKGKSGLELATVRRNLEHALAYKGEALDRIESTVSKTPPPPPSPVPATFTIELGHVFGAGPSSSTDCETVSVHETGSNVIPTGTLNLTGPGGFNATNTLTFTQSGTGTFAAPSTFLFTAFGTYSENASITVAGTTMQQMGTFTLDASNDKTTPGCPVP